MGGDEVTEGRGITLGVAVHQVADSDLYSSAEITHIIPAITDDSFFKGEHFFEKGGDILQELF